MKMYGKYLRRIKIEPMAFNLFKCGVPSGVHEPHGIQRNFCDESVIRNHHGYCTKENLKRKLSIIPSQEYALIPPPPHLPSPHITPPHPTSPHPTPPHPTSPHPTSPLSHLTSLISPYLTYHTTFPISNIQH